MFAKPPGGSGNGGTVAWNPNHVDPGNNTGPLAKPVVVIGSSEKLNAAMVLPFTSMNRAPSIRSDDGAAAPVIPTPMPHTQLWGEPISNKLVGKPEPIMITMLLPIIG